MFVAVRDGERTTAAVNDRDATAWCGHEQQRLVHNEDVDKHDDVDTADVDVRTERTMLLLSTRERIMMPHWTMRCRHNTIGKDLLRNQR